MPTLEWIGKDKVINHHQEVPYRLFDRKYTYGVQDSENMIIHGDNLLALKSLLPQYQERIDCIYIDPPYNTGNEKWVYNDNVNDPRIKKWLGEVVGSEGEDLSRHDKWLCMMYPRLKLLHKLLSTDGILFASIDYNENFHLRAILNEIFGTSNFVGEIYWESKTKSQNTATAYNKLQPKAEMIFVYAKNGRKRFNLIHKAKKEYPFQDTKGTYREHILEVMNALGVRGRESMVFPISDGFSTVCPPKGKQWQLGQVQVATYLEKKDFFIRGGKVIIKMRPEYERDETTEPFWGFFGKDIGTAESAKKELTVILGNHGFETVKPLELITRLIYHVSNKNSVILDSFAGSGTTAHAVLNLNKKDGGNRKFILVEMMNYADTITAERVKRVIDGYGTGEKAVEGTGGGFSYYELGAPLFKDDNNLNEDVGEEEIRKYVYYMETKKPLETKISDSRYYLGKNNDTAYYFYYKKDEITTLNHEFLSTINTKATEYVFYADKCSLSQEIMKKFNITFKKIPRDITRL